jgi:hypothetical protein
MSKPGPIKQRWITWVWKHTSSCAEISRLASRSLDGPLPWRMWLKIRLHFLICVFCHRYFQQLRTIHEHAPKFGDAVESATPRGLTPDARQRIKVRLVEANRG